MRIVLIGAESAVGSRVARRLEATEHRVTSVFQQTPSRALTSGMKGRVVESLRDPEALARIFANHDAVVNLAFDGPAGPGSWLRPHARRNNELVRKDGNRCVASAARKAGVALLVQQSSAYAYPDCGSDWIEESSNLGPSQDLDVAYDAEASAAEFSASEGRAVILRFAALYGPDSRRTRIMVQAVRRGWSLLAGRTDAFISSVSHDDAAAAVIAALRAPAGTYNVADDHPLTHKDYMAALAACLNAPVPRSPPMWCVSFMGPEFRSLSRSIRLSNRKLRGLETWQPRDASAAEGLVRAIAAMRNPPTLTREVEAWPIGRRLPLPRRSDVD